MNIEQLQDFVNKAIEQQTGKYPHLHMVTIIGPMTFGQQIAVIYKENKINVISIPTTFLQGQEEPPLEWLASFIETIINGINEFNKNSWYQFLAP